MRAVVILAAWIFSVSFLFSQFYSGSIPEKTYSDPFDILPFWVSNPLNLKNFDKINLTGIVSPSRFLVKDLNSVGTCVGFPLPLNFKSSLSLTYIGSPKFFYSQAGLSLQKEFFDKFNFASSFYANFFTITSFGYKTYPNINIYLEYLPVSILRFSFKYKNLFEFNQLENSITGFGCLLELKDICALGLDCNIILSHYTSYSFNVEFVPFENFCFDAVISTLPQTMSFSLGYKVGNFIFSYHFHYHYYLGPSQAFCFSNEF